MHPNASYRSMWASSVGNVAARDPLTWKERTAIILQIAEGMFVVFILGALVLDPDRDFYCYPLIACLW